MTEQEIVNILKENKTKGIAYMFLPEEVWNWISENFDNPNLLYLDSMGKWQYFKDADFDDYDNVVFALPEMYELPVAKVKGEWVEFEINQRGQFLVIFTQNLRYYFNWFEWWRLLEKSIDYNYGFTAFGGWKFEDNGCWHTCPTFKRCPGEGDKPCIPVKIRFWRENK